MFGDGIILSNETFSPKSKHTKVGFVTTQLLRIQNETKRKERIEKWFHQYVEDLISDEVPKLFTDHPKQKKKPLIRIRVEYKEENSHCLSNAVRLGMPFHDRVFNYREIFLFKRVLEKREQKDFADFDPNLAEEVIAPQLQGTSMEDLVARYFEESSGSSGSLKALGVLGVGNALKSFADKDDKDAIPSVVSKQLKKVMGTLSANVEKVDLNDELERIRESRKRSKTGLATNSNFSVPFLKKINNPP